MDEPAHYRLFGQELKPISENEFNTIYAVKASDNVLEEVRKERRNELALEGLRLYDLVRWGTNAFLLCCKSKSLKYPR